MSSPPFTYSVVACRRTIAPRRPHPHPSPWRWRGCVLRIGLGRWAHSGRLLDVGTSCWSEPVCGVAFGPVRLRALRKGFAVYVMFVEVHVKAESRERFLE